MLSRLLVAFYQGWKSCKIRKEHFQTGCLNVESMPCSADFPLSSIHEERISQADSTITGINSSLPLPAPPPPPPAPDV